MQRCRLKAHYNDSKPFIEFLNNMDDICEIFVNIHIAYEIYFWPYTQGVDLTLEIFIWSC